MRPVKLVTVFFDLEAPFLWKKSPIFDLESVLNDIRYVLTATKIKAVFNTCGDVAEKFPDLVAKLHRDGHEIASHGYAHENFAKISMTRLDSVLKKTEIVLEQIIGEKPIGIRSPWLIRNQQIYTVFRKRGYKWVSNLDLSYPSKPLVYRAIRMVKFMFKSRKPSNIQGLLEIPLLSPLDIFCIQPFPEILKPSPEDSLRQAYQSLITHYMVSGKFFNLNFHPQIIGTMNRLSLLKKILCWVSSQPCVKFVLAKQICGGFDAKKLDS